MNFIIAPIEYKSQIDEKKISGRPTLSPANSCIYSLSAASKVAAVLNIEESELTVLSVDEIKFFPDSED
jgi:hypothetical protein